MLTQVLERIHPVHFFSGWLPCLDAVQDFSIGREEELATPEMRIARIDPGTPVQRKRERPVCAKVRGAVSSNTPWLANRRKVRYSGDFFTLSCSASSAVVREPLASRSATPSLAAAYKDWWMIRPSAMLNNCFDVAFEPAFDVMRVSRSFVREQLRSRVECSLLWFTFV